MKKLFLALTAIAVAAAIFMYREPLHLWLATELGFEMEYSVDQPELQASAAKPLPLDSNLTLPILIPHEAIRAKLEAEVAPRFEGEEKDVAGNLLRDDVLTWWLERGQFAVADDEDALHLNVPLTGRARLKGKALIAPFSTHIDLAADMHLALIPKLIEGWRLDPDWQGNIDVKKAKIRVLGAGVSVRNKISKKANKAFEEVLLKQREALINSDKIRESVEEQWQKLHINKLVSESPPLWMQIEPSDLLVEQFQIDDRGLNFALGLLVSSNLYLQGEAPAQLANSLPDVNFAAIPEADLRLNVLSSLSLADLSHYLREQVIDKSYTEKSVDLSVAYVNIVGSGERLLIELGLNASYKRLKTKFNLYLWALPVLNENTLSLQNIEFSLESTNFLLDKLAWLGKTVLLEKITKALEAKFHYELSETLRKAHTDAEASFQELLGGLPPDSTLSGNVTKLEIKGLQVAADNLYFSLHAETAMSGEIVLSEI